MAEDKTGSGSRGDFKYPEGLEDVQGIKAYAEDVAMADRYFRHEIERTALRNILYYLGVQWIRYDPQLRVWRPQGLKKTVPRPVTNRVAMLSNLAASTLVAYKVPVTYGPASFDPDDVAAANVADRVHDIIEKESKVRSIKPVVAKWTILTGNCFLIPQYDNSPETGTTFIPSEQCPQCNGIFQPAEIQTAGGMCPTCQGPTPWQPAIGGDGQPIGVAYPRGRFYTEVLPIFSCHFDYHAASIQESAYFMVSETKSRDWVERTYSEEIAKEAKQHPVQDSYTNYVETLAYSTAIGGRVWGYQPATVKDRVRVRRLWLKPHPEKAPNGIYAVIVGDTVVEATEWPYHDEQGKPFLNVVHMGFDPVPGRLLYKTRVDDVAPKQEQRNRIESVLELHSIRMANAVWLIPDGAGLKRVSGEEGFIVRYNALPGVPAPQRVSGDSPPPYLANWLLLLDQEMESIMGLSEVSRGEAPRGVSAYAALQLLDERAQAGQSTLLDNWSLGWMEWSKQMLHIWREWADEERVSSVGEGEWAMDKFSSADLKGGIDVSVELGQFKPRTQVGRRAVADQAIRLGLANPFDPNERIRLLELLGIPELMEDYKIDQAQAAKENDQFLALGMGPEGASVDPLGPPVIQPPQPWDNHDAHVVVHRRFLLSDKFKTLPPNVQAAFMQHVNLHWQVMKEMAQSQRGAGTVAPGRGDKENKGTAEGGGGSSGGASDEEQIDLESQMASPDTNTGSPGKG